MKKYLQITIVLAIFFVIVLLKQVSGNQKSPIADNNVTEPATTPDSLSQSSQARPLTSPNSPPQPVSSSNTQPKPQNTQPPAQAAGKYKNGTFTGNTADASYGNVQIQVTISNGRISNVQFLQYPNDNRTSSFINSQAMPMLKYEAIQVQSAQVDGVTGASYTSQAFASSLSSALRQAS